MKRSRALASRFLPIWRLSDRLMNAEPVDFNLGQTASNHRQTCRPLKPSPWSLWVLVVIFGIVFLGAVIRALPQGADGQAASPAPPIAENGPAAGAKALPARHANGRLIGGQGSLNPAGRRAGAIASLRERYLPRLDELMEGLFELATHSPNEMTRLAATREILDRLLGKPPVAIDSTVTKFDFGTAYLESLRRVNGVIDGGKINGSGGAASDPTEIQ
jgi:hypothetical protein